MLKSTAESLADLRCPACGTRQQLWTLNTRSKVILRRTSDTAPCPGCQTPLRLTRRTAPEVLAALLFVTLGAGAIAGVFALTGPLSPGWTLTVMALLGVALFACTVLIIGLISRHTRTVVKGDLP